MSLILIGLLWFFNLGVSFFNAVTVGKGWVEAKHAGGWARFMAIMAASGFSWCISIPLGAAAHLLGGAMLLVVLLLVAVSAGGGILLTWLIIHRYAASSERMPLKRMEV